MQWLGPFWQNAARSHSPDEGTLPGLAHTKVASIEYSKAHLHQRSAQDCKHLLVDGISLLCQKVLSHDTYACYGIYNRRT